MKTTLEQKIASLPVIKAPIHVESSVFALIREHEENLGIIKRFFYAVICLASSTGTVMTAAAALSKLQQSGFGEYLGLVTSDLSVLSAYWKELALTILDMLPVANILVLCATLVVVALSIQKIRNLTIPHFYEIKP